jgi:GDP-mannose 6-dehydrogenase
MSGTASRLSYTTDARAAADTDASIIMVSTPYEDSRAVLSSASVERACNDLCIALRERVPWRYHLVIISSTLMPGTMSTKMVPTLEAGLG